MKHPFSDGTNALARLSLFFLIVLVIGSLSLAMVYQHFPIATGQGAEILQPIPFSHQHHVQGLGLDCRYCHTSVEKSANAGFPDTATCVGCHSMIWNQSAMLEPVRESARTNTPLHWFRVNNLPDYVYFDHSIHINKGIGCVSCHGLVGQSPRVVQKRSFLMRDCLECHKAPEKYLRPASEILNENWHTEDQLTLGRTLMKENNVHPPPITNCSVCHR
jgi:cytochrome c3-like protein